MEPAPPPPFGALPDVAAMDATDRRSTAILDALPSGVLVVDHRAGVRFANRHVRDLLGWSDDDYVGRSLFDFVLPDDIGAAATALAEGPIYFGNVLGPMRMRYVDATGAVRFTEYWARELDDRSGYALVAPHGSVVDMIGDAVQAIATGEPVERAIELIVAGFSTYPTTGSACLLRAVEGELTPMTPWPLADRWWRDARDTPWQLAVRTARDVDVNDPAVLGELGRDLATIRCAALWCRPVIDRRGDVSAVVVVFRPLARPATANQQHRMRQLVNVAALAFDQLEYRRALEHAAFTDELTGAATRARLRQELDDGLEWSAVLYVDLDGFKAINDEHGHAAGDAALAEVGRRLRSVVRGDDLVVRLGGDEFLLVVGDAAERDAAAIAGRVLAAMRSPLAPADGAGDRPQLAASVGVCVRTDDMTFDEAVRIADAALAQVKQRGKGHSLVAGDGTRALRYVGSDR